MMMVMKTNTGYLSAHKTPLPPAALRSAAARRGTAGGASTLHCKHPALYSKTCSV